MNGLGNSSKEIHTQKSHFKGFLLYMQSSLSTTELQTLPLQARPRSAGLDPEVEPVSPPSFCRKLDVWERMVMPWLHPILTPENLLEEFCFSICSLLAVKLS